MFNFSEQRDQAGTAMNLAAAQMQHVVYKQMKIA